MVKKIISQKENSQSGKILELCDGKTCAQNNIEIFCNCLCHTDGMNVCARCNGFHEQQIIKKSMIIRELQESDFDNGFFETLNEFRCISGLEYIKSPEILGEINNNEFHRIIVAIKNDKVVGCLTILIERKFIHNCGTVLHLEDLIVRKEFRNQHIAEKLVNNSVKYAKKYGAYKILTDCKDQLIPFWEKCGFKSNENAMRYNTIS